MNRTTKYKVTIEFDVDISPISVPDVNSFEKMGSHKVPKKSNQMELRKSLKGKGLSDTEIEKYLTKAKENKNDISKDKPTDYQLLLYPEYEKWADAQRSLQVKIFEDEELSSRYIREIVRDLTQGKIESLMEKKYGPPDLSGVLSSAMQKISAENQQLLKSEEESLRHDETELLDESISCCFTKLSVHPTSKIDI
ncbi:MAG: hypothetical protein ACJ0Q6_02260 [Candidatus Azotimanducaceae bacterium]|nr:hypothetical protein [Gammaproteobacteria bacterium]